MTNKRHNILGRNAFFLLMLLVTGQGVAGQPESPGESYMKEAISQRDFDRQQWKQAIEGIDYSKDQWKTQEEERARKRNPGDRPSDRSPRPGRPSIRFGDGAGITLMKFLIIAIAVITLAIILRHLLGPGAAPKNKKIPGSESSGLNLEQIEENLHESDFDHFIRQALEQGNYNLAVRLYYLAILKNLSLRRAIHWKKNKTNLDYLREMRHSELFESFRDLTTIFERIWYGNRVLDHRQFQALEPRLKGFINQIKASHFSEPLSSRP